MDKKKNIYKILLFVFVGIAILLSCFIAYDKFICDNVVVTNENVLKVYGNGNNLCENSDVNQCNDIVISIETETNNPILLNVSPYITSKFSYVLYYDNGLKLYDINEKVSKNIDVDIKKAKNIDFLYKGFLCQIDNDFFYYDLEKNEKKYTNYDIIRLVSPATFIEPVVLVIKGNTYSLLNVESGKVIVSRNTSKEKYIWYELHNNFITSSVIEEGVNEESDVIIYNLDGKKIYELNNDEKYEFTGIEDEELIIYTRSIKNKFNSDGKLLK